MQPQNINILGVFWCFLHLGYDGIFESRQQHQRTISVKYLQKQFEWKNHEGVLKWVAHTKQRGILVVVLM
jgi:hypothetical protein